jgi:uncharacterized protein YggE
MLQHKMLKRAGLLLLVISLLAMAIFPAAAQDADITMNTITVIGNGKATAAPDMATIEIGVEFPNTDVAAAYSEVNTTIERIIEAIVALGVAREDIRTTGVNIYSEGIPTPEGQMENRFRVGNRVQVTVRDLSLIESVIDTAVTSGANNIFGLQFGISDPSALEADARVLALDNARERAGQIAENIEVELGDIVSVVEMNTGAYPMFDGGFGGAASVVEPGQLTVNMQVQVTFQMNR